MADGLVLSIEARAAIAQLDALEGRLRAVGAAVGDVGRTSPQSSKGMDRIAADAGKLGRVIDEVNAKTAGGLANIFSEKDTHQLRKNMETATRVLRALIKERNAAADAGQWDKGKRKGAGDDDDTNVENMKKMNDLIVRGTRALEMRIKKQAELAGMSMKYYAPNSAQMAAIRAEAEKMNMQKMHTEANLLNKGVDNERKALEEKRKLRISYDKAYTLAHRQNEELRTRASLKYDKDWTMAHRIELGKRTDAEDKARIKALAYDKDYTMAHRENARRRNVETQKSLDDQIRNIKRHTLALQENTRREVTETKRKIDIGEKLSDSEQKEIKRVNDLIIAKKLLTAAERRYASQLGITADRVRITSGVMKNHMSVLADVRLAFSRLRNLVLVYSFALRPMINILKTATENFRQFEQATLGVTSVGDKFGISSNAVKNVLTGLTRDGLIPVTEASKALSKILSTGIGLPLAEKLMIALKDSAAFNRQGMLSMGEAVLGAAQGFKNMRSQLTDNAGITKNLSIILKEQAEILGVQVSRLTEFEKHQMIANGLILESSLFSGDAAKASMSVSGQLDKMNISVEIASRSFGEFLAKSGLLHEFTRSVIGLAKGFERLGKALGGRSEVEDYRAMLGTLSSDDPNRRAMEQHIRESTLDVQRQEWQARRGSDEFNTVGNFGGTNRQGFVGRGGLGGMRGFATELRRQGLEDPLQLKSFDAIRDYMLGIQKDESGKTTMRALHLTPVEHRLILQDASKQMANLRAKFARMETEAIARFAAESAKSGKPPIGKYEDVPWMEAYLPGSANIAELKTAMSEEWYELNAVYAELSSLEGVKVLKKPPKPDVTGEPLDPFKSLRERLRDTANLATSGDKYIRRIESFQKTLNSVTRSAEKLKGVTDEQVTKFRNFGAAMMDDVRIFVEEMKKS